MVLREARVACAHSTSVRTRRTAENRRRHARTLVPRVGPHRHAAHELLWRALDARQRRRDDARARGAAPLRPGGDGQVACPRLGDRGPELAVAGGAGSMSRERGAGGSEGPQGDETHAASMTWRASSVGSRCERTSSTSRTSSYTRGASLRRRRRPVEAAADGVVAHMAAPTTASPTDETALPMLVACPVVASRRACAERGGVTVSGPGRGERPDLGNEEAQRAGRGR